MNSPHKTPRLTLTRDDKKVLGNYEKKREKATLAVTKFQTRMLKTQHSNWTPIIDKPSNEQIYKERKELVSNWFDLWSDSQRRRFFDTLFKKCRRSQLHFIQKWFKDKVPLKHLDFTTVLPRFLSLYIFSFLDPRSLCRASVVSWNWKFLCDQDAIWMPKCLRFGWFIPYTPTEKEYGAWKRHYIACIKTLDAEMPAKGSLDVYGTLSDGSKYLNTPRTRKLCPEDGEEVLHSRPPWKGPDFRPQDLVKSDLAVRNSLNPNDPDIHSSLLFHHDKFGIPKKTFRSVNGIYTNYGLESSARKKSHRAFTSQDDEATAAVVNGPLSAKLELESFEERRMMELVHQPWEPPPPKQSLTPRRPDLSGGGDYPLPWKHNKKLSVSKSFPSETNPRLIFISSRVPAADVLVDAVNFGVIPIVYEYEGTTLESLLSRLDNCLLGRSARSIGIFAHSDVAWELKLVHGASVSLDKLDNPEFVDFFQGLANLVLPPSEGGHIDLFVPLASCEPGTEMLTQLKILTGMTYTAPTGIVGNYNHISSDWLTCPEEVSPPSHYFCTSKLRIWTNTADQVVEACKVTKTLIGRYFEQQHKDLVSQLTGQIVFDATGEIDIMGVNEITEVLTEGLIELGNEQNKMKQFSESSSSLEIEHKVKPLEFLGTFLLDKQKEKADYFERTKHQNPGDTLAPTMTMSADTLSEHLRIDESYAESLQTSEVTDDGASERAFDRKPEKHDKNKDNKEKQDHEDEDEDIEEEIEAGATPRDEDKDEDETVSKEKDRKRGTVRIQEPMSSDIAPLSLTKLDSDDTPDTGALTSRRDQRYSEKRRGHRSTLRITPRDVENTVDRRTLVAKEILASENAYKRTLLIMKNVFFMPLKSALDSNRAIISAHNLQIIFSDCLTLCDLSCHLVEHLENRISDWGPQQCIGDIFVKFSGKLKAYVNFLNNYTIILSTFERCMEQTPIFRAFLKRYERKPETNMLALHELLLAPMRRIGEFVTLLTWFKTNTPPDHADRADVARAIEIFADLDELIREYKLRGEREKELVRIQKKILSSPILLEANRFFLKQLDVAHLKPPSRKNIAPELTIYQHVQMLGLYLFNDSLVVTRRTTKHYPFERSLEHTYHFEACSSLVRLRIEDIPDSKYVSHAFKLYTPSRSWICGADTFADKIDMITFLEKSVCAALSLKD